MSRPKIKRALISVYDKTGIVGFARTLVDEFQIELISTGGTAALLMENGIQVTLVEDIAGFPEMLDGRVKTLHPRVHAAILADRDNPEHMRQLAEQGIEPIDMVVVNLYPFAETIARPDCTFEQAIEMIDIGGPCLLRAAAKNHRHVVALSSPASLQQFVGAARTAKGLSDRVRMSWARDAFDVTHDLDGAVFDYFIDVLFPDERVPHSTKPADDPVFPGAADWDGVLERKLLYGENPHQDGAVYSPIYDEWHGGVDSAGLTLGSKVLQGEMTFNNYADANAALEICRELSMGCSGQAVSVLVKHTNACGVGVAPEFVEAYKRSYLSDPVSAFGGVLAQNQPVTVESANVVMQTLDRWGKAVGAAGFFLEAWMAPAFDGKSIVAMQEQKHWGNRVRLLAVSDMVAPPHPLELDFRKITGGMLVQTRDLVGLNENQWKAVTKRRPSEEEMADLRLAWLVAKHTKSNAISICKDGMLIGNGAGQMSRVMSCRIATWLARENGHMAKLAGSAAASDAFFPFPDGPNLLLDAGVTAIIQPGGSKRDADTIAACDERGAAMVFTGTRHFKH